MRLALAACFAAFASAPQPDAADLLRRVAEQYRNTNGYFLEARVATEQGPIGVISPVSRVALAVASGGRYSLSRPTLRVVSDGQTIWTWRDDLNQYTVEPAGSGSLGEKLFRGAEENL